ncbi:universal stress protein [Clostridium estertheticum]|uniref:universal stress protein n=1 Tax=Clostridium estertheticum TaxID=238834 RepID=UPI001CF419F8|nr:universal stress protein [Clostridium estertheticum]MCB2361358.1 universal stress protein [Clostridium estertheticum]
MKKIKALVPLDGTERSMHSLNWLKTFFSKDAIAITLMNVVQIVITNDMVAQNEFDYLVEESNSFLDKAKKELEGYDVEKFNAFGYAGEEILKKAKKDSYDIIVMTKSSKKGLYKVVGSVTTKVVRNAHEVSVIVIPE